MPQHLTNSIPRRSTHCVPLAMTGALDSDLRDTSTSPDGGYGWVCVLGQFFINGFTWGVVAVCDAHDYTILASY